MLDKGSGENRGREQTPSTSDWRNHKIQTVTTKSHMRLVEILGCGSEGSNGCGGWPLINLISFIITFDLIVHKFMNYDFNLRFLL